MIRVWRIVKTKHTVGAFTGIGSGKYGARWNSRGTTVVYTAESRALAVLEILVHLDKVEFLQAYSAIEVRMADHLIENRDVSTLPSNWADITPPPMLRLIGDRWVKMGTSVALRVPSVLVPGEYNYLLNPVHPNFHELRISRPEPLFLDPRLKD